MSLDGVDAVVLPLVLLASFGLGLLFPLRWGWRAMPLVLLALLACVAVLVGGQALLAPPEDGAIAVRLRLIYLVPAVLGFAGALRMRGS